MKVAKVSSATKTKVLSRSLESDLGFGSLDGENVEHQEKIHSLFNGWKFSSG